VRRRTYTVVEWSRASAPDERLCCHGLTARVAFSRLLKALVASGCGIVVHRIEPEGRP
jgi:hypothetical protein